MLKLNGFFVLLFLTTANTNIQAQPLWETLNNKVIKEHIIPHYKGFQQTAQTFSTHADNFCANVSKENLQSLRNAYSQLNQAWMRIQHIRNGPPIEQNHNYFRIQLFPDKRNAVGKHLAVLLKAENTEKLNPKKFKRLSVALQGITALEHLLFSDKYPLDMFRASNEEKSFTCGLVLAISHSLDMLSTELVSQWTSDTTPYALFVNVKKFPLKGNEQEKEFKARTEITSLIYNQYHTQLRSIIEHKLMLPLGKELKRSKPHFSESKFAQHSLSNISINLVALKELYQLTYAPLLEIKSGGAEINQDILNAYDKINLQIKNIELPLRQAVSHPQQRQAVEELLNAVKHLHELTVGPMQQLLAIPIRFNAMDGD